MTELVATKSGREINSRLGAVRKWRFEDLLTFADVMEAGSVTAAAARLNLSKSVVSKRIQVLETALDIELFQRSTRQIKPTDSGEALYAEIVPLIHEFDDTVRRLSRRSGTLHGCLRIAAPISVGTTYLATAIAQFAHDHPELELAVDYDDHIADMVRSGYDLAIRIGALSDSCLISRKLYDCQRVVCCSPAYARQRGVPKQIADLANHVCIDHSNIRNKYIWEFEGGESGKTCTSVPMRGRVVANSDEAMRDMAIAGFGLVLLPHFVVAASLQSGELIPALLDEKPTPHAISAVYPSTRHVSCKVRAFIDHLVTHFRRPMLHQISNQEDDEYRRTASTTVRPGAALPFTADGTVTRSDVVRRLYVSPLSTEPSG